MNDKPDHTEEDVQEFRETMRVDPNDFPDDVGSQLHNGSSDGPEIKVHPGAVLVGFILTIFSIYGMYLQNTEFTAFTLGLLTVLALGSKYINE